MALSNAVLQFAAQAKAQASRKARSIATESEEFRDTYSVAKQVSADGGSWDDVADIVGKSKEDCQSIVNGGKAFFLRELAEFDERVKRCVDGAMTDGKTAELLSTTLENALPLMASYRAILADWPTFQKGKRKGTESKPRQIKLNDAQSYAADLQRKAAAMEASRVAWSNR